MALRILSGEQAHGPCSRNVKSSGNGCRINGPWKYGATPAIIVGAWNMNLPLSWRVLGVPFKKGYFYTISHFSKSFRTCNPTHSSQRPFESASSLLPLWTEEGGLSKWSHLTKTTPIGEPGLEGRTPALTSGSGVSACVGEGGGTWKDEKLWPDVVKSLCDHLGICPRFTAKFKKTWNNRFTLK